MEQFAIISLLCCNHCCAVVGRQLIHRESALSIIPVQEGCGATSDVSAAHDATTGKRKVDQENNSILLFIIISFGIKSLLVIVCDMTFYISVLCCLFLWRLNKYYHRLSLGHSGIKNRLPSHETLMVECDCQAHTEWGS